jgi:hypothetical protein
MNKKTKRLIPLIIIILIILFIYFCSNRFYIPYGSIFNILPVNEDRVCILYMVNIANKVYSRIGCINTITNKLIWYHDLPGKFESLGRGLRVKTGIVTVRCYIRNEDNNTADQKILAYSVENGRMLWESENITYFLKDKDGTVWYPCYFNAYQDNEITVEHFETGTDSDILIVLDIKTGRTLWKKECPLRITNFKSISDFIIYECSKNIIILNKNTGKQIAGLTPYFGYSGIIENCIWYFNRDNGLQYYDLNTKENIIVNSNFCNSQTGYVFPHSYGKYNNKYFCLLERLHPGEEEYYYEIVRFSPETGEILWEEKISDEADHLGSLCIGQSAYQKYPEYFFFNEKLTRFIPLMLDFYTSYENTLVILDLEEEKIVNKYIHPADFEMDIYRYGFHMFIFDPYYNEMLIFNGNTGDFELFEIPVFENVFHPFSIGDKYIWFYDQGDIVQFPETQWVKFDYENNRVEKCIGIKADRFRIITDKLELIE